MSLWFSETEESSSDNDGMRSGKYGPNEREDSKEKQRKEDMMRGQVGGARSVFSKVTRSSSKQTYGLGGPFMEKVLSLYHWRCFEVVKKSPQ